MDLKMAWNGLLIGGVEFVLSIVLGLVVVFTSYELLLWLTPKLDEERELSRDNRAAAVYLGAGLLSVGIIVREAIDPIMSTVQDATINGLWSSDVTLRVIGYGLLFVAIVFLAAVGALAASVRVFAYMTRRFDEEISVRQGNLSLGILFAAVTIVMALFIANGAGDLAAALIPDRPMPISGPP